jgi:hypothetical protein
MTDAAVKTALHEGAKKVCLTDCNSGCSCIDPPPEWAIAGGAAAISAFHWHLAKPQPSDTIHDATRRFLHRQLAEAVERAAKEDRA